MTGLPTVRIDDILVHPRDNDLIVGTHGRSIWIIDDITPLQQTDRRGHRRPTHISSTSGRRRRGSTTLTKANGLGADKHFRGQNPPGGAAISYYLKAAASGDVKITISDSTGRVVRDLDGTKEAGLNRVQWNLAPNPAAGTRGRWRRRRWWRRRRTRRWTWRPVRHAERRRTRHVRRQARGRRQGADDDGAGRRRQPPLSAEQPDGEVVSRISPFSCTLDAWRSTTRCFPSTITRWRPRGACSTACRRRSSRWKPHDKSMTLGQLAGHLANIPFWCTMTLDADVTGPRNDLETWRGRNHPRRARTCWRTSTARSPTARDQLGEDDRPGVARAVDAQEAAGRSSSRCRESRRIRTFVMNHSIHHRGQLCVYLRLNDVPLPPIYGPTADEQF